MEYDPMVDEPQRIANPEPKDSPQTLQEALDTQTETQPTPPQPEPPPAPPKPAKRPRGRPRKIPPTWTPDTATEPPQDYGQELILDIHEADATTFTREHITDFMHRICDNVLSMEREDLHFWDYEDEPKMKAKQPAHLKGISAVQFIKTSNITIHTLDDLKKVFINIFSCKKFNPDTAERFSTEYFRGKTAQRLHTERK
jgi:S-adenosylmethionine/arginine decarboxylase-like enzyme